VPNHPEPSPLTEDLRQIIKSYRAADIEEIVTPFGCPSKIQQAIGKKYQLEKDLKIAGVAGISFY
jgi:hypothetical protein